MAEAERRIPQVIFASNGFYITCGGSPLEVDVVAVGKQPPRNTRSRRHAQNPGHPTVPFHFGMIVMHPGRVDHHPHKIRDEQKGQKQHHEHGRCKFEILQS